MSRTVDLTDYSEEELVELNRRIVERLRALHQQRRYKEMARFNLGDTVSFTVEAGRAVVGKVIRANTKTITVLSSTGAASIGGVASGAGAGAGTGAGAGFPPSAP